MIERELTESEMADYLSRRDVDIKRGERVVDLMQFAPFVTTDENGQEWLVYRKVEYVTGP